MNRRTSAAHVAADSQPQGVTPDRDLAGSTLVEVLVALGIAAVALTLFVSILQLGVHSVATIQERVTATTLARSQMETVKLTPWPGPYPVISTPTGYTLTVAASSGPIGGIQMITVRVAHAGRDVLTLEGYKGQR